jgi:hypothetical protein
MMLDGHFVEPQITQMRRIKKQGFGFAEKLGKPIVICLNLSHLRNLRLKKTDGV